MATPFYFDSDDVGAPTLNNTNGSLLEIIRACGINGYNTKTISSIVVASGVATATAATHGYTATKGKRLLIAGSAEAGLNGAVQPLTVTTNNFTYAAPGVADGTYTGSVTVKRAPFGLVEDFTGTNVAVFSRSAPEATAQKLRINDSGAGDASATGARAISVESATDVNTYSGVSPLPATIAAGFYVNKGVNNTTAKKWRLVGTAEHGFYLFTQIGTGDVQPPFFWLDLNSFLAGDAYRTVIAGSSMAVSGSGYATAALLSHVISFISFAPAQPQIQRAKSLTGGAVYAATLGRSNGSFFGGQGTTDFSVVTIDQSVFMAEDNSSASNPIRGVLPGCAVPLANKAYAAGEIVTTASGRVYLSVLVGTTLTPAGNVLIALDNW